MSSEFCTVDHEPGGKVCISLANEVEISIFSSTFPHLALGRVLMSIGVERF